MPGDLGGRSVLEGPAVVQHQHPVGQRDRLDRFVGDDQTDAAEAARCVRRVCRTWARVVWSRAASGSSSSSSRGRAASARGQRRRAEPDRRRAGRACGRARCPTPSRSSHCRASRRASARGTPWARSPYAVLASALRCGKSAPSCGTQATPRRCGGSAVTSVSPRRSDARARGVSPRRARSRVVLPAPLGPTTAMVVPGSASRVSRVNPLTSACSDHRLLPPGRLRRVALGGREVVHRLHGVLRQILRGPGVLHRAAGPAAAQADQYGHRDDQQQQRDGGRGLRGVLEQQIHLERQCLRGAGKIPGEGDRRTELTERPRPGERSACGQSRGNHGQRHGAEHPYW